MKKKFIMLVFVLLAVFVAFNASAQQKNSPDKEYLKKKGQFNTTYSAKHCDIAAWCKEKALKDLAENEAFIALELNAANDTALKLKNDIQEMEFFTTSEPLTIEYAKKKKELLAGQTKALLSIATWCRKEKLVSEYADCLDYALKFDPENAEIRQFLGFIRKGDSWVDLKTIMGGRLSLENTPKDGWIECVYDSFYDAYTGPFDNDFAVEFEITGGIPQDSCLTKMTGSKSLLIVAKTPSNLTFNLKEEADGKNGYEYAAEANGIIYKTASGLQIKQIARSNVAVEQYQFEVAKPMKFEFKRKGGLIHVSMNGKTFLNASDKEFNIKYYSVNCGCTVREVVVSGKPLLK